MSDTDTFDIDDLNDDSPNFAQLRKKTEAAEARAAAAEARARDYRDQLVRNAVELAGFKAGDDGQFAGVTGLLFKEFQASLTDEDMPTSAAFIALAEQYGVKPEAAPSGAGQPSVADQIAVMQQAGDQLRQVSTTPDFSEEGQVAQQIADLEAEGKWTEAGRLKRQLQRATTKAS